VEQIGKVAHTLYYELLRMQRFERITVWGQFRQKLARLYLDKQTWWYMPVISAM
jgi:hypothetical protein